jgi:hypothetical protein
VPIPVRVVRPGEDPDAVAPEFEAEGVLEVPDEVEADAQAAGGEASVDVAESAETETAAE